MDRFIGHNRGLQQIHHAIPAGREADASLRTPMSRNALCSCGSGKRFKHCCGMAAAPPPSSTRDQALGAHRAGALGRAESLYRRALVENPRDVDVLHMLGTVQFERMRYREALDLLWDAAERTDWSVAAIRHNLGLVLGKLLTRDANAQQADLLEAFVARERARRKTRTDVSPLVSVVLPAYNHARYVAQAIASVASQRYPNIELIVIDDGSTDGSAAVIAEALTRVTCPVRFIVRENRGAPATLNEGAALARGRYLAFLNSDDYYAPDRIASLVEDIAGGNAAWGFSLVSNAPDDGEASGPAPPVPSTSCRNSAISWGRNRTASRSWISTSPSRAATCSSNAISFSRPVASATTATTTTGISACARPHSRSRWSSIVRCTSTAFMRKTRSPKPGIG